MKDFVMQLYCISEVTESLGLHEKLNEEMIEVCMW